MVAQHILAFLWLALVVLTYLRMMKTHQDAGKGFRTKVIASATCLIAAALIFWLGAFSAYSRWFVPEVYPLLDWLRIALVVSGGALIVWAFIERIEGGEVADAESTPSGQAADPALAKAGLVSLNKLRMALSQPYPFVELAGIALDSALRIGEVSRGALYVYNEVTQEMTIAATAGLTTAQERAFERLSLDNPILNEVFTSGETLISTGFIKSVCDKSSGMGGHPGSHGLLVPITRTGSPLGLLAVFSDSPPQLTTAQSATLTQMADIIADKFINVKLRGELARTKKKALDREETRRQMTVRFQQAFDALKKQNSVTALCEELAGIGGADSIAVVEYETISGSLAVVASSADFPQMTPGFEQATRQALQRQTLVLLSREKKPDVSGAEAQPVTKVETPVEREPMALVAPVPSGESKEATAIESVRNRAIALRGILFWNSRGRFHLTPEELQDLQDWLLPLTITLESRRQSHDTNGAAQILNLVRDLLQPGEEPLTEQQRIKRFVVAVRDVFGVSDPCIVFKRSKTGQLRPVRTFGISLETVASMVVLPGEGALGRCAALGTGVFETGHTQLTESANEYDMLNRDIFGDSYSRFGNPQAHIIAPVMVNGAVRYALSFFFTDETTAVEVSRALAPLANMLSLVLSVREVYAETGATLLSSAALADAESAVAMVNDVNNDLATIIGNCQLVADDPNLSGAVERVLRLVIERAEHSSEILQNRQQAGPSDSHDNSAQLPKETVAREKSTQMTSLAGVVSEFEAERVVGGQILLTEGKAREVEFLMEARFNVAMSKHDARTLIERLSYGFSAFADEREIVTLSGYEDNGFDYFDISRRWRNLPSTGQIGSYARFEKPESDFFELPADLIEKLHNADVEVALDRRNTRPVYLTLRVPNSGEGAVTEANTTQYSRPQRILAIDDQTMILDLLRAMCDSLGYHIDTFESPARAIAAFERGAHDIVITDVAMPEMDGWQVASAVNKLRPETYVIFVTGWQEGLSEERLQLHNVSEVIKKPFRLESLTAALEKASRRSQPRTIHR